jgi:uncharacterized protein YprB with RNaseH-like and TPR domain
LEGAKSVKKESLTAGGIPLYSFAEGSEIPLKSSWVPDTSIFTPVPQSVVGSSIETGIPALQVGSNSLVRETLYMDIQRDMRVFWNGWQAFNIAFNEQINGTTRSILILEQLAEAGYLAEYHNLSNVLDGTKEQGVPNWVFLDIETCGFAGNPLFLIGITYFKHQKLELHQFFARDYEEEAAVLRGFWGVLEQDVYNSILVTYNGKSFDWPFIQERSWVHDVTPSFDMNSIPHLDLMHLAKKTWKANVPNCKLQTLEKYLLNRYRVGDVHGELIPSAYQTYVENPKEWNLMAGAIHHNALDIISLGELLLLWSKAS